MHILTDNGDTVTDLRSARKAVGLTRAQLAGLADCSISSLGDIEAGAVPRHSRVLQRAYQAIQAHAMSTSA
jgi:predicted transcriptional regulator